MPAKKVVEKPIVGDDVPIAAHELSDVDAGTSLGDSRGGVSPADQLEAQPLTDADSIASGDLSEDTSDSTPPAPASPAFKPATGRGKAQAAEAAAPPASREGFAAAAKGGAREDGERRENGEGSGGATASHADKADDRAPEWQAVDGRRPGTSKAAPLPPH